MEGNLYDTVYSWSLLVALVAAGLGALLFVYFVTVRVADRVANRQLIRLARVIGPVALVAMVLSVTVHLVFGHAPGSPEPMGVVDFIRQHQAYWLVLILAALAVIGPMLVEGRH